jgi:hypothetical protein
LFKKNKKKEMTFELLVVSSYDTSIVLNSQTPRMFFHIDGLSPPGRRDLLQHFVVLRFALTLGVIATCVQTITLIFFGSVRLSG